MRRLALGTFLAVALGCGGGNAETPVGRTSAASTSSDPSTPAATRGGATRSLSRAAFLADLRPPTTALFCSPDSYFRQCFAVSEADCIAIAGMAFDACAAQLGGTLPATITGPDEGEAAGQAMGACTGAAYDQALASRGLRHDTPACNEASNWGGG